MRTVAAALFLSLALSCSYQSEEEVSVRGELTLGNRYIQRCKDGDPG